jgi:vacuolar-type H+-ATPase subunit F/Vma7
MMMTCIVMGEHETAAGYFEKGIEKRETGMLYIRDLTRFENEKMYVPQVENVLEEVEAIKLLK